MKDQAAPSSELTFSVDNLLKHFSDCLGEDEGKGKGASLDMEHYILAYEEIYRFLNLLGTVFGWVASDVGAKIEILKGHRAGVNRDKYATVLDMVEFEVGSNLIKYKSRDSGTGSRNLLRLHRALEYVSQFLQVLPNLKNADQCCPASQEVYKKTLAKFHPWVVQKAALFAMKLLPTKEGLIHKFCGETEEEYQAAADTLALAVDKMNKVYERTQEIYREHKILDLP